MVNYKTKSHLGVRLLEKESRCQLMNYKQVISSLCHLISPLFGILKDKSAARLELALKNMGVTTLDLSLLSHFGLTSIPAKCFRRKYMICFG